MCPSAPPQAMTLEQMAANFSGRQSSLYSTSDLHNSTTATAGACLRAPGKAGRVDVGGPVWGSPPSCLPSSQERNDCADSNAICGSGHPASEHQGRMGETCCSAGPGRDLG